MCVRSERAQVEAAETDLTNPRHTRSRVPCRQAGFARRYPASRAAEAEHAQR